MKLDLAKGIINYSGDCITLNARDVDELEKLVLFTEKKRIRICLHSENDLIHEMIIVVKRGSYIRPARHIKKTESLHVIKGIANVIFFNNNGEIEEIKKLSQYPESNFYYRMNTDIFHTLIVDSDFFMFHETTNGPFIRDNTIEAMWAPHENQLKDTEKYMLFLNDQIESFYKNGKLNMGPP